MRKIYLLFSLLSISFVAGAQSRDGTCDPIDSLLVIDTMNNITLHWERNDTALAYNYRFRLLGDTTWTTNATLDSFFAINELGECVEYEVGISTVCPFDTSTFTLDTVSSICPSATNNILVDPSVISIYPIPFDDNLTIRSLDQGIEFEHVAIRALNGQLIIKQELNREISFSMTQDWPTGVYLVEVKTNKGWYFQKVLKL